jgi:molybdopterin converting factor small subunit
MQVQLWVPAALRTLNEGRAGRSVELADGSTVADLLDAISTDHRALERRVRDEQGTLRPHVNIFVGEDNIRSLAGAGTILQEGDAVSILPAISGG